MRHYCDGGSLLVDSSNHGHSRPGFQAPSNQRRFACSFNAAVCIRLFWLMLFLEQKLSGGLKELTDPVKGLWRHFHPTLTDPALDL